MQQPRVCTRDVLKLALDEMRGRVGCDSPAVWPSDLVALRGRWSGPVPFSRVSLSASWLTSNSAQSDPDSPETSKGTRRRGSRALRDRGLVVLVRSWKKEERDGLS